MKFYIAFVFSLATLSLQGQSVDTLSNRIVPLPKPLFKKAIAAEIPGFIIYYNYFDFIKKVSHEDALYLKDKIQKADTLYLKNMDKKISQYTFGLHSEAYYKTGNISIYDISSKRLITEIRFLKTKRGSATDYCIISSQRSVDRDKLLFSGESCASYLLKKSP